MFEAPSLKNGFDRRKYFFYWNPGQGYYCMVISHKQERPAFTTSYKESIGACRNAVCAYASAQRHIIQHMSHKVRGSRSMQKEGIIPRLKVDQPIHEGTRLMLGKDRMDSTRTKNRGDSHLGNGVYQEWECIKPSVMTNLGKDIEFLAHNAAPFENMPSITGHIGTAAEDDFCILSTWKEDPGADLKRRASPPRLHGRTGMIP
jgi:hypothetical protein